MNIIKILVVEDNHADFALVKGMLHATSDYKFDIKNSETLHEAIELCSKYSFDVVLLDLGLPDSIGVSTIKKFKKNVQDVPVVVYSGLTNYSESNEYFNEGADNFIEKGVEYRNFLINAIISSFNKKRIKQNDDFIRLQKGKEFSNKNNYSPYYGDITLLNKNGLLKSNIEKSFFQDIAKDVLNLLDTSLAVYELDGSYAFGIFSSGWCRLLDQASRVLCDVSDNKKALECGKWLCHECCWHENAKVCIDTEKPVDIKCVGGLNLYGEPIFVNGKIAGVINIGYGNPPKEEKVVSRLARKFNISLQEIKNEAKAYTTRPEYIVKMAKDKLKLAAKLIGKFAENKLTEDKLKKEKEFSQKLIDVAPAIILNLDKKGKVVSFNKFMEDVSGYSLNEVKGKDWFSTFVCKSEIDDVKKVFKKAINDNATAGNINSIVTKNGKLRQIKWYDKTLKDNNEKSQGLLSVGIDVTEKIKAEQELKSSEYEKSLILNNTSDLIAFHNPNHELVWANKAYLKTIDKTLEEVKGKKCWKLRDLSQVCYGCPVIKTLETGKPNSAELTPENQPHWPLKQGIWLSRSTPVKDEKGKLIGVIEVATNITDLKLMGKKYKQLYDNAQVGIFRTEIDGSYILEANDKFCEIFGYTNDEIKLLSPKRLWKSETDRNQAVNLLKRTGRLINDERVLVRKNGELLNALVSVTVFPEENINEGSILDITELRKTQDNLISSRENMLQAQEMAHIGSWDWDIERDIITWSDEMYRLWGFKPKSFIPKYQDFLNSLIPDDLEKIKNAVAHSLKTGETYNIKYTIIRQDGEKRIIHAIGNARYNNKNEPVRLYGSAQDITQKENLDKLLIQEKTYSENLIKSLADGFLVHDTGGKIIDVNSSLEKMTGFSRTEIINRNISDFIPVEQRIPMKSAMSEVINSKPVTVEHSIHRKNGDLLSFSVVVSPLKDMSNKVTGAIAILRDITEKKNLESRLAKTQQLLQRSQEVSHFGSWEFYVNTKDIFYSDEMYRIWGYEPNAFLPTYEGFLKSIITEDRNKVSDAVQNSLKTGEKYEIEYTIVRPNGEKRYIRATGEVEFDENRMPVKLFGGAFDVTEKKQIEEILQRDQKMKALGEFSAGIAHDFNNTMQRILLGTEQILSDNKISEETRYTLSRIKESVELSGERVKSLLLFSGRKETALKGVTIDLNKTISRTIEHFQPLLKEVYLKQGLTVSIELTPGQPVFVKGSESEFLDIFYNIIKNSADAMIKSGVIRITTEVIETKLYINIIDNGKGMDKETASRVFEPFFTTKKIGSGTGIGLCGVYAMIKSLGGSIRIKETAMDLGTTIEIVLPVSKAGFPACSSQGSEQSSVFSEQKSKAGIPACSSQPGMTELPTSKAGFPACSLPDSQPGMTELPTSKAGIPACLNTASQPVMTELPTSKAGIPACYPLGQESPSYSSGNQQSAIKNQPSTINQKPTTKILWVDDEEDIREMGKTLLNIIGQKTLAAESGKAALEILKKQKLHILVTDIGMPDMSGWQLVEQVRTLYPEIKIAVLSGWDINSTNQDNINKYKVDYILQKPVGLNELREMLKTMLD